MTRYLILIVLSIASAGVLMSQSVGIGTTTPNNKAILDVSSTDRGILLPRLSDTSAVSPPVPAGLTIYSLADNRIYYFNGSRWIKSNEQSAADGHWFIKNDSILYTNRTYVGINTNLNEMPPQASLQVNGGLLVQGDYKATVAAPTASQIYTMDNSASQIINSTDSIFRIFDTGGPSNYLVNTQGNVDVFSSANQIGFKISFNAADFGLGAGDTLWIGFSGFPQCRTNYLYRMTSTSTPPSDFVINTMGFTLRFVFRSDGSQVGPGFDITVKRLYKKSTYPAIQAVGNAMYFDINSGAFRAGVQAASSNMGVYSTALGSANTASGYASTALGESNTASGSVSTALGSANTASGYASTALGESNTASGNASTALGQGNTASGNASTALGYFNTASGHYSTALGYFNTASGHYSTALGYLNTASGSASTALGYNNTAKASHSFVVGRYNDTIAGSNPNFWVPTDPLFMVGNGSSSTQRSNAVTVYKNGNTDIKGFTRLGDDAPRIQTKLLTTISPPTQGAYIAVNHGLTFSKIISVTAVLTITSSEQGIIPGYRTNNGYEYGLTYDNIGIYISNHPTNSANILSQPVKIFITYIE